MSEWVLLVREVAQAGGRREIPKLRGAYSDKALPAARALGLLEPAPRKGGRPPHYVVLTQRGRDYLEGKVEPYRPGERSARAWRATWLASLPVGVRLTTAVHHAQNDGTCYW